MRTGLFPAIFLMPFLAAASASAAPCEHEDFETSVSGSSECLLMRRYGSAEPAAMIVWLHGNVTSDGPANSHFRLAQKAAADLAENNVLAVALVRPGYPDGTGAYSSGDDNHRADNWDYATIMEIGSAIERLRRRYKPKKLILAGHSGGAAIAAALMGMKPKLAEGALLIACPCDLAAWRARRPGRPWISENPIRWAGQLDPTARIVALTGSQDDTTRPELSKIYVERLKARGIDAVFETVPDAGHIDILKSSAVAQATVRMIRR